MKSLRQDLTPEGSLRKELEESSLTEARRESRLLLVKRENQWAIQPDKQTNA